MEEYHRSSHAVYMMQYHLVLVTKDHKPLIVGEVADCLKREARRLIEENFEGHVVEMEADKDHIHILMDLTPKYSIQTVVNSLKGVTARIIRRDFNDKIGYLSKKDSFWSNSYFIASTGGVTIDVLKRYVENQLANPVGRPKGALGRRKRRLLGLEK